MFRPLGLSAALACLVSTAGAAPVLPDFTTALFPATTAINPYFPLTEGTKTILAARGVNADGPYSERSELTNIGPGRTILGVQTTAVLDKAYEGDLLVEETTDYYATDSIGNVWYMGEDVTNFIYDDDGNLIETNDASSWIAGIDGALPGWIMPAVPTQGLSYFQEFAAANDALDEALIWAVGQTVTIDGLGVFSDVLISFESTSLDPEAREFKYYAPGIGLIRADEGLNAGYANPELIFTLSHPAPVPIPAAFPLLLAGLVGVMVIGRRRKA